MFVRGPVWLKTPPPRADIMKKNENKYDATAELFPPEKNKAVEQNLPPPKKSPAEVKSGLKPEERIEKDDSWMDPPEVGDFISPVESLVLPTQEMDVFRLDKMLQAIGDPNEKRRAECYYIGQYDIRLNSGLYIMNVRMGIILILLKAIAPPKKFEKTADELFPKIKPTTRRLYMRKAHNFLKKFEPTYGEAGEVAAVVAWEKKWTLLTIVNFFGKKTETAAEGVLPGTAGGVAEKPKPPRSHNVCLPTFKQNVQRLNKVIARAVKNAKRIAPENVSAVEEYIKEHLPAAVAGFVLQHLPGGEDLNKTNDASCQK